MTKGISRAHRLDIAVGDMTRDRFGNRLVELLLAGWLLMLAGCGAGSGSNASNATAAIRTLAYVDTECSENAAGVSFTQSVRVLVGDGPALTVYSVGPIKYPSFCNGFLFNDQFNDPCHQFGSDRFGAETVLYGALKRIGVSPDGSGVVFEVNDPGPPGFFQPLCGGTLPAANKGMFYVRSDGTGLRRLGDPSREPSFGGDLTFAIFLDVNLGFSPDSRRITFPDGGPGPTGDEATQIFTLDVVTGVRTQVTRLPSLPKGEPQVCLDNFGVPVTSSPFFLDTGNIAFFTATNPDGLNPGYNFLGFTIGADGTLTPAPLPVALPGSQIVPIFAITGPDPSAAVLPVSDAGKGACAQLVFPVVEVFLLDGDFLLQLTNFGRQDTITAIVGADRERVFFNASADPLGTNPSNDCQIFSIDRTGANLRQLTSFSETGHSCFYGTVDSLWQDPVTQTVVFTSSSDPFGKGYYGAQIFAMRPDGSGLRQLTDTQGLVNAPGGATLELPGPFAYSATIRPLRAP